KGDYDSAIADWKHALKLNPKLRDVQDSIRDVRYSRIRKGSKEIALEWNDKGFAKAERGDYDGAIRDYDRAIELNPEYAEALYNRGVAKSKMGDWAGAIADFDEALELKPKYALAYAGRGEARMAKGDCYG
ncbi:MAG: tetratricopeptide repeat protein, partial [Planctomycetota bacterium]|nr:tetratricopeptide repeat protein [Planctomycetota bacterium]